MATDYPTDEVPATPEYVLEVLRKVVELQIGHDALSAESSVIELIGVYDDLSWHRNELLARYMNTTFAVDIPLEEWQGAFPKPTYQSVGEVCEFIAERITRPQIRPWRSALGESLPAGAFLTLKAMLAKAGADVSSLSPSTRLDNPTVRKPLLSAIYDLVRISPVTFPPNGFGERSRDFVVALAFAGVGGGLFIMVWGAAVLGVCNPSNLVCQIGLAASLIAWVIGLTIALQSRWSLVIPGIETFRDLSYALAGEQPRPQRPSNALHVNRGGSEPGTQA